VDEKLQKRADNLSLGKQHIRNERQTSVQGGQKVFSCRDCLQIGNERPEVMLPERRHCRSHAKLVDDGGRSEQVFKRPLAGKAVKVGQTVKWSETSICM
jgi:hypothetical protein